jgi:hypothetical protein
MINEPMEVSWIESLAGVPQQEWNRLAAHGGFYLSHAWLSIQEDDPDSQRHYAVARMGGRLVGALSMDIVEKESNDFYTPSAVLPDGCAGPDRSLMVLGGHGGYRSGFVLDPVLDAEAREGTVHALLDRVVTLSRELGRAAVFFYLQDQFREVVGRFPAADEPLLARHEATLRLPGSGWTDYLGALRESRRTKIRREERRFSASGYQVAVGDLTPWLEPAGRLLANMQRRYGHEADAAEMSEHLAGQIRDLGEHVAFLCSDEQGLIGFALTFPFGDTLWVRAGGFAYERLRGAGEYFNLGYYQPIRWAYENGIRTVQLGIESLDAKAHRGATLSPLWVTPIGWSWPDLDSIRRANGVRAAEPERW